jgi:hypothetical protein
MDATFEAVGRPRSERSLIGMIAGWATVLLALMSSAIWIPVYSGVHGTSPAAMGLIASLQTGVAGLTAQFVVPRLIAMQPRSVVMIGLSIVAAAESAAALLSAPLALFATLKAIDGVGDGLALASVGIMASRTLQPTRTFGLLQLSQSIASTIFFALSSLTIPRFGLPGIFGLVCVAAIVAIGFAGLLPRILAAPAGRPAVDGGTAAAGRLPLWGCLTLVLILTVNVGTINSIGAFGARLGMAQSDVSIAISAATLSIIASSAVAAAVASIIPNAIVLGVSAVIASLGLVGIGFAETPLIMELAAFSAVFGITLAFPAAIAGVGQADETGRAAAAAQASGMLGLVLGPVTAGIIITNLSLDGLSIIFAVVIFAAIGLASLLAAKDAQRRGRNAR